MTTILPGSVCQILDEFRQEFQVQKKENIVVLCSGPSQNDIRNFARRRSSTTVKNIYIQKSVIHLQSFCFVSQNIFNFCHSCYPCIMICLAVAINSREK